MSDNETEITLRDWVNDEHERIKRFVEFWQNGQVGIDAELFPVTLPTGEWDEQYRLFTESRR